jgi:hypothetical protein
MEAPSHRGEGHAGGLRAVAILMTGRVGQAMTIHLTDDHGGGSDASLLSQRLTRVVLWQILAQFQGRGPV